ncbi:hypothetical protein CBL_12695 [Carabus blaptoides fortunei]
MLCFLLLLACKVSVDVELGYWSSCLWRLVNRTLADLQKRRKEEIELVPAAGFQARTSENLVHIWRQLKYGKYHTDAYGTSCHNAMIHESTAILVFKLQRHPYPDKASEDGHRTYRPNCQSSSV